MFINGSLNEIYHGNIKNKTNYKPTLHYLNVNKPIHFYNSFIDYN